jgi:hypothetical protein
MSAGWKLINFAGILIAALSVATHAAGEKDAIKRGADENCHALVEGNYERVITLTYPKIVEMMGGKDAAVSVVKEQMKGMKDQGVTIVPSDAEMPGEIVSNAGKMFAVVSLRMVLRGPKMKISQKSFLIAVSSDQGKSWTFIDGSGLNDEIKAQVIPELPPALKLPAKEQPKVEQIDS